jgi:3-hydroxy-9,10-secoandrosta-1,3,5(10)-triene-9,17-dione monooxygenase
VTDVHTLAEPGAPASPSTGAGPSTLTRDAAIAHAARIAATLPERWAETEQLRRVPDRTIADLRDAGLLRINQPARFGGAELGLETILDVGATLGEGDVSVGWTYVILASHQWIIGLFPDEAQHDVWDADDTRLMSSAFAPSSAQVERVDGGYRLRVGRWPWSSGSDHAQWAMLGFRVPAEEPGGPTPVRWALVPRSDYEVLDDWRTTAVQGTGSNTLAVTDAIVPDHRVLDPFLAVAGMAPGAEVNPSPIFRLPFTCLAFYLAAPILGGTRAAARHFTEYIGTKTLLYTGQKMAEQEPMLVHIGEVAARASAAETLLRNAVRDLDASAGAPADPVVALGQGRDCAFAVRLCVEAVDEAMRWSGASAVFEGHPANKRWRDVRALSSHQGFNSDTAFGNWGRIALGLPPAPGIFG